MKYGWVMSNSKNERNKNSSLITQGFQPRRKIGVIRDFDTIDYWDNGCEG